MDRHSPATDKILYHDSVYEKMSTQKLLERL